MESKISEVNALLKLEANSKIDASPKVLKNL